MKVTVKGEQTTSFDNLFEGDCFKHKGSVYLKVGSSLDEWNAFDLITNDLTSFSGTEKVVLLEAELIIS